MKLPKIEIPWYERALAYVAPRSAAERLKARATLALAGAWNAGRYDRNAMASWAAPGGNADSDNNYDLDLMRRRSRDQYRNNPVARGAINTVVRNAVGTGLVLQSTPKAEVLKLTPEKAAALAKQIETEFNAWAESKDCDLTRTLNFYGLQELSLKAELQNGDSFAVLPMVKVEFGTYATRVQLVEADRVGNPPKIADGARTGGATGNKVFAGVEVDGNGAPVAYHICRVHPYSNEPTADKMKYDRVQAFGNLTGRRNVVHQFRAERPEQKRGVPYLAPVMESLKQLTRYSEAELMAAVVGAMFTVFVKSQAGDVGLGEVVAAPDGDRKLSLGNGSVVQLGEGEDVSFADPKRPNAAYDPFVTAIMREIGIALELPYEVLVKHFTASYSAARAALMDAWKFFLTMRTHVAQNFCQPIFEAWMDEAVALNRIDAPGYFADPAVRRAYQNAEWVGDAPGSIDPEKEANAAEKRLDIGVSTRKKETMELTGMRWEDVHAQQVREQKARVKDGLAPDPTKLNPMNGSGNTPNNEPGKAPAKQPTPASDLELPERT